MATKASNTRMLYLQGAMTIVAVGAEAEAEPNTLAGSMAVRWK